MKTVWDFVEKYYPNYHQSDVIAYHNDLLKIRDNEYDEGDSADKLLQEEFKGWVKKDVVNQIIESCERGIFRTAIENYINGCK